jgi:hypothetical protein
VAETFPPGDVEASANDPALQRQSSLEHLRDDQRQEFQRLRAEAIRQGATEAVRWIYFRSPEWTWRSECGREGWLLYDPETGAQHAFFMTVMS